MPSALNLGCGENKSFPRIAFSKPCFEKAILQRGIERGRTLSVKNLGAGKRSPVSSVNPQKISPAMQIAEFFYLILLVHCGKINIGVSAEFYFREEHSLMRIWFNHWFSTAYHLIRLMRGGGIYNNGNLEFIGSSTNPLMAYLRACDEQYSEPENLPEKDYVDWCLEFCREHKVDVFVPRRGLVAVSERYGEFEEIGVKLFVDKNAEMLRILDNKTRSYDYFRGRIPKIVPEMRTAHSVEEFENAYNELKGGCERVCYKLETDEGARSFRVIDDKTEDLSALLNAPNTKVSSETALKILGHYDFKIPVLLMPYLGGQEISADCLYTAQGYIILPRFKNGRYSNVKLDKEIMSLCQEILDNIKLEMPLNIQLKFENGAPYLLEINPRMSGGLQLSCNATGINIPHIALNRLLGNDIMWSYPEGKIPTVVNLETPLVLGE